MIQQRLTILTCAPTFWDKSKAYIHGYQNLLYSFNLQRHVMSTTHPQYGMYSGGTYGPTFGRGGGYRATLPRHNAAALLSQFQRENGSRAPNLITTDR